MSATHLAEPHVRVIRNARNGPDEKRPLPDVPGAIARVAMAPTVVDRMPEHPTTRGLNRAAILQMQRMHGNRHVQRMLVRQSGPIVQRCGGTPCGCSQEEQVRHAVEQVPEVAAAASTIAAMPVARQEALVRRLADPEHGPVLMQRLSEPGTGVAFLQRLAQSGPAAMPAIQRQSLQRGWFDDEEESGTEDSGSSMWDSASETVGGAMDWAGEQVGGAADWASEQAGGAADWAGEQAGGAMEWSTEQAGGAADWVTEQAGSAADWAGEQVGGAVDWATEQGGAAADWVSEKGGAAVDWAAETGGEARDWASEQTGGVADWATEQGSDLGEWAGGIDPGVAVGKISAPDLKAIEAALRLLAPHAGRAAMIAAAAAAAPALPLYLITAAVFLVISTFSSTTIVSDEEERKLLEESKKKEAERRKREQGQDQPEPEPSEEEDDDGPSCESEFPAMELCGDLELPPHNYSTRGGSQDAAHEGVKAALKTQNAGSSLEFLNEKEPTTNGPCIDEGLHTNVFNRSRKKNQNIGSIVCCPCCEGTPTGPLVEGRCKFVAKSDE